MLGSMQAGAPVFFVEPLWVDNCVREKRQAPVCRLPSSCQVVDCLATSQTFLLDADELSVGLCILTVCLRHTGAELCHPVPSCRTAQAQDAEFGCRCDCLLKAEASSFKLHNQ